MPNEIVKCKWKKKGQTLQNTCKCAHRGAKNPLQKWWDMQDCILIVTVKICVTKILWTNQLKQYRPHFCFFGVQDYEIKGSSKDYGIREF